MSTTNINVRTDPEVKRQAQELFAELGLDLSTAVNIFLRKSIRYGGIPFEVISEIPNAETIEALKEVEELKKNPNKKTYNSFSEILEELDI